MPSCTSSLIDANVLHGPGSLQELEHILENYSRILLFAGKNSFHSCGAAAFFQSLEKKLDIQRLEVSGKALPIEMIEELYEKVKNSPGMQAIVAIGGGTVMDAAKIISIAYSNHCAKAADVLSDKSLENALDLVMVPTTAGSGSEATTFAVVYKDKVKFSVANHSLAARYVILDPLLLQSLPNSILNSTVLDATAQAVESAWAVGSTSQSREFSRQAINFILGALAQEPSIERFSALQMGSFFAGKAINISKTTLSHAISYPLTAYFGIPHGIAVFLSLPAVAAFNYAALATPKDDEIVLQPGITTEFLTAAFSLLFDCFKVDNKSALVEALAGVPHALGTGISLQQYGIKRLDLEFITTHAVNKGRSDNNPRQAGPVEIKEILEQVFFATKNT